MRALLIVFCCCLGSEELYCTEACMPCKKAIIRTCAGLDPVHVLCKRSTMNMSTMPTSSQVFLTCPSPFMSTAVLVIVVYSLANVPYLSIAQIHSNDALCRSFSCFACFAYRSLAGCPATSTRIIRFASTTSAIMMVVCTRASPVWETSRQPLLVRTVQ